jgi:predicted Zn-dependent protease
VFYDGRIALMQGHIASAITQLTHGMELDPEHTEMQEMLEQATEMQIELGDEAVDEAAVAGWLRKYKLKVKLSEASSVVSTAVQLQSAYTTEFDPSRLDCRR